MTTINYNPSDATAEEFTADELDSIKVGEALEEQSNQQLAGKFQNAEQLEKAYIELQSKLGEQQPVEAVEEDTESEVVEQETTETPEFDDFLSTLWDEAANGEFSDDVLGALDEYSATDMAQMFLDYKESNTPSFTQEDVNKLKDLVGGEDTYNALTSWAEANMDQDEIDMYDAVMDRADPASAFFAIQSLLYKYHEMTGVDGELLTGGAVNTPVDAYRSQAEVVRDMSDARYDSDPAYRNDVMAKLSRSPDNLF